jgi:hypothetical protein
MCRCSRCPGRFPPRRDPPAGVRGVPVAGGSKSVAFDAAVVLRLDRQSCHRIASSGWSGCGDTARPRAFRRAASSGAGSTLRQGAENGDVETAYRLSDRAAGSGRCRTFMLTCCAPEALHRMGDRVAAVADLVTALQIAPDDIAANRRMLLWAGRGSAPDAARALIAGERDMRVVRQAIAVLRKAGQAAFAGLRIREGVVEGWGCLARDRPDPGLHPRVTRIASTAALTRTHGIPCLPSSPCRQFRSAKAAGGGPQFIS